MTSHPLPNVSANAENAKLLAYPTAAEVILDGHSMGLPVKQISVRVAGTSGPTLVFVHGNSSSGSCWDKQFDSQLVSEYRLISIDFPGHGSSSPSSRPDESYTLPGMAVSLARIIETLGIHDALYVGWSLGGHVLLEAFDFLPRPRGILILGCPPTTAALGGFKHIPPAAMQASPEVSDIVAHIEALVRRPEDDAPFDRDFAQTDPQFRSCFAASIKRGNFKNEVEVVKRMHVALAIIHGAADQHVDFPYLQGLEIPSLWRQSVQVVPEARHAVQWDAPEAFNLILSDFARDTSDSTTSP